MSVGSKVIFLVFAVGLQSLFNGDSIGCAYAKPVINLTIEHGTSSNNFYKLVFSNIDAILKMNSHEAIQIGDQNTVQESQSAGFLNTEARIDHQKGSNGSGPGAFYLGTHNTVQTSNSNMTINTGSLVTYRNNVNNSK